MILHENRLLADDSHEISYLIFFRKLGKMSQNLSSAAVVIGAFRVKSTNSIVKYPLMHNKDICYPSTVIKLVHGSQTTTGKKVNTCIDEMGKTTVNG